MCRIRAYKSEQSNNVQHMGTNKAKQKHNVQDMGPPLPSHKVISSNQSNNCISKWIPLTLPSGGSGGRPAHRKEGIICIFNRSPDTKQLKQILSYLNEHEDFQIIWSPPEGSLYGPEDECWMASDGSLTCHSNCSLFKV